MSRILYGTHWVQSDEPCLGLQELNLQSPYKKGLRRYQIIHVVRDNKPAEYRKDLGDAKNFKAEPIWIIGGVIGDKIYIEHTVGELVEMANQERAFPLFSRGELPEIYQYLDKHGVGKTGTNQN